MPHKSCRGIYFQTSLLWPCWSASLLSLIPHLFLQAPATPTALCLTSHLIFLPWQYEHLFKPPASGSRCLQNFSKEEVESLVFHVIKSPLHCLPPWYVIKAQKTDGKPSSGCAWLYAPPQPLQEPLLTFHSQLSWLIPVSWDTLVSLTQSFLGTFP